MNKTQPNFIMKVTTILLVVTFIISFFPPVDTQAQTYPSSVFDHCGLLTQSQYQSLEDIDDDLHYNMQGLQINAGLFHLYGIAAYGPIGVGEPQPNTFYPGYQYGGPLVEGKGRFHHPSLGCGEYRFYGFDYNGNLYANPYYRDDVTRNYDHDKEKRWIYLPWNYLPKWYGLKPDNAGASYEPGETNPMSSEDYSGIRQNLAASLMFEISRGIKIDPDSPQPLPLNKVVEDMSPADGEFLANYAVINTAPGLLTYGSAAMYHRTHLAPATNILYIGFPLLPQIETGGKEQTPVEGHFRLPGNVGAVPDDNVIMTIDLSDSKHLTQDTIKLDIPIEGILKDEEYVLKPALAFKHYTRENLKDFSFRLASGDFSHTKEGVPVIDNRSMTTIFEIEIPVDSIAIDGLYELSLYTKATFEDGVETEPEHRNQKFIQFVGLDAPKLITDFNIHPAYFFNNSTQYLPSHVGYKNTTHIDQEYDMITLEVCEIESYECMTPYTSSKLLFSDSTAQTHIYNFIKSFFSAQDLEEGYIHKQFKVTQTIKNIERDIEARKVRHVSAMQGEYPTGVEVELPDGSIIFITPPEATEILTPIATIPDRWYDVVPFPASDQTQGWETRSVTVDSMHVDPDLFFSGQWISGVNTHGLKNIVMEWTSPGGVVSTISTWTVIYDTKPRVQIEMEGLWKQNRIMTATNTSAAANDAFVTNRYPMSYTFEFLNGYGGDDASLRTRSNTATKKEFIYKEPGVYALSLTATNSLGRVSDPYIVEFEIRPDEAPAVIVHPYDQQVARGEQVRLLHDVKSIDGDDIEVQWVKLWHDAHNDGSYDVLIETYTEDLTEIIAPNTLGYYKLEAYAKEETAEPIMAEYMTPEDYKEAYYENYFEVANYQPMSEMYIERQVDKPAVDVYFMLDRDLTQSKINYMNGNVVDHTNLLIGKNLSPAVSVWDMKTYTYSRSASTSRNTGTSSPPSSISYSSGGYSGTLQRSSISNSPYQEDEGSYKTRTVTTTETRRFTSTCTNTRYYDENGNATGSENSCPQSVSVNSDGFIGSIPRTNTVETTGGTCTECYRTWIAYYGGDLSKTVTKTEQYWEPNWVTYNNYTGYYNGTIYRSERQSYDNSFMRTVSDKFVVYISDSNISQINDLQMVLNNNDAILICVGNDVMQQQISCDEYIENNNTESIESIVSDIVNLIAQISPPTERIYRLIDEQVTVNAGTADIENDPIVQELSSVWWDPEWFDDPNGFDNSEGSPSGIATSFEAAPWGPFQSTVSYNKPGKYILTRKVQDQPTADPIFSEYSLWSNESKVQLIVHRKPIADVILDWDYDAEQNNYKTTWIDLSYDLDHEFNHPEKGIVERTLSLRNNTTGVTLYTIPERLNYGSYTLTYAAKDVEGVWSDTITMAFTLENRPPIQMDGQLRTELSDFSLNSIPASEQLRVYDLWTRYPYQHSLNLSMGSYNQTVNYYTGTKQGNDIYWQDVLMAIPATTPDGEHAFTLRAIPQAGGGAQATKTWQVNVHTPIDLVATKPASNDLLVVNHPYDLEATTSQYVTSVTATMFYGTSYARTLALTSSNTGNGKRWARDDYTMPNVPSGHYHIRYVAATPSGKSEAVMVPIEMTHNRPPIADFDWTPQPAYEGDVVTLINTSHDPDGDELTYQWRIKMPGGFIEYGYTQDMAVTLTEPSTYEVELIVSDGWATGKVSKQIQVNPLLLIPDVSHTPEWLEHHMQQGHEIVNHPKDFYSGELFLLNVIGSDRPIREVKAWLETKGRDGSEILISTLLTSAVGAANEFQGELYDPVLHSLTQGLPNGTQHIQFSITYENGIVKEATIPVRIIGHTLELLGVKRRS